MRRIHTITKTALPYSPEQIWEAIADFSGYHEWWPSSIRIKVIRVARDLMGSRIEIRPYGGQGFECAIDGVVPYSELRLKYSGIYRGTGLWTLSGRDGQCLVTYEITLEIDDRWVRCLSYLLPIGKIHSRLMTRVLSGLERQLAENIEKGEHTRLSLDRSSVPDRFKSGPADQPHRLG